MQKITTSRRSRWKSELDPAAQPYMDLKQAETGRRRRARRLRRYCTIPSEVSSVATPARMVCSNTAIQKLQRCCSANPSSTPGFGVLSDCTLPVATLKGAHAGVSSEFGVPPRAKLLQ